jgi:pilus assembly protein Flp/PilA
LRRGRDPSAILKPWLRNGRGFKNAGPIKRQENPMFRVRNFLSDESGVTAIEYALIASLIAVAIIGVVTTVGDNMKTVFGEIGAQLK